MMNERETVIDIEGFVDTINGGGSGSVSDDRVGNVVSLMVRVDQSALAKGENPITLSGNMKNVGSDAKRKSMTAKKPPRPPRGLSLDAADQKLIKELSELAMIKRARNERMKALKKMKAAKASSPSSSAGNSIATLVTILFCIVIIFGGCHPSRILLRNSAAAGISNPLKSNGELATSVVEDNSSTSHSLGPT